MEILVVAMIALIVFGPEKLPEIARTVGRTVSDLRRMAGDVRSEFTAGFGEDEEDLEEDEEEWKEEAPNASSRLDRSGHDGSQTGGAAARLRARADDARSGAQRTFQARTAGRKSDAVSIRQAESRQQPEAGTGASSSLHQPAPDRAELEGSAPAEEA